MATIGVCSHAMRCFVCKESEGAKAYLIQTWTGEPHASTLLAESPAAVHPACLDALYESVVNRVGAAIEAELRARNVSNN